MASKSVDMAELFRDLPKNWGRWGADDEIGCLNFLTSAEVLRGVRAVKQGSNSRLHRKARKMGVGAPEFLRFGKL